MAENPCVPKPKRTYSEHDLWFPEPAAALTLAPTWLRRIGRTTDGQAVTLAMVLEEEPPTRHEDRIAEHRQALEAMIELSEVVLGSTPVGAAARGWAPHRPAWRWCVRPTGVRRRSRYCARSQSGSTSYVT